MLEVINENLIDKVFFIKRKSFVSWNSMFIGCLLAVSNAEINIDYKNESGGIGHPSSIGSPSQ